MRATRSLAAAVAWAACGSAAAFEQCRTLPGGPPTSPCATISQVIAYLVLPAALAAAIVFVARRWVRRDWLRFALVSVTVVTSAGWTLFAIAILQGFLAPCAASCWY